MQTKNPSVLPGQATLFQHGMAPWHCTMASWHGSMAWMKGRKPVFHKTPGPMFLVMKSIWVRALKLMFGQVYIARPCLQF